MTEEMLERLAKAAHLAFCDALRARGYVFGPVTNDERRIHSALRPFGELPGDEQEQNRDSARAIPTKLAAVGYVLAPTTGQAAPFAFPREELERLAELEHERWMGAKLAAGWRFAPTTDKTARLDHNLVPWAQLTDADKEKDRVMVREIPALVALAGYRVAKQAPA